MACGFRLRERERVLICGHVVLVGGLVCTANGVKAASC